MSLRSVALVFSLVTAVASPAARAAEAPSFTRHVSPLLFKLGCSAGTCHGSFSGKGGLQLSLFAARPELDYQNIRYGGYGRRLDLLDADASLLLRKPSMQMPHGGGLKLDPTSEAYRLLRDWIAAGAPADSDAPAIVSVRVEPASLVLKPADAPQALKVVAVAADGTEEDVTRYAAFESRDPSIAVVDGDGRVSARHAGDVPVLVHYAGHVTFSPVAVPAKPVPGLKVPVEKPKDELDRLISAKLASLNIVPSPVCDDAEFVRRVYLDTLSVLPTPDEVREFLNDKSPDKRTKLIDRLLEHPLHAAQWATKMSDLFGADNRFVASAQFHDWFRNKFERNWGWDEIAYGVLCATAADDRSDEELQAAYEKVKAAGQYKRDVEKAKKEGKPAPPMPIDEEAERVEKLKLKPWQTGEGTRKTLAALYSSVKFLQSIRDADGKTTRMIDSKQIALQTSNALLGVQLTCAQCHKHPSDKWTQRDFYGFAAVFTHVQYGGVDPELTKKKVGLAGPFVSMTPCETFEDPSTHEAVGPKALDGPPIEVKEGRDPRRDVWEWMTAKDNPYFARGMVNRVWAQYLGRGFFEPVDAQAAANPPSHPEVLDLLARDFAEHEFDIRRLERRVLNSLTYQRSWRTNASNATDLRNFSHRTLRRLTAEQLLDAVLTATGTPHKLEARNGGVVRKTERIIEMSPSRFSGVDSYVLTSFGKPLRVQSCDCERSPAPSLGQSLYLYNDEQLMAKIGDPAGRVQKLVDAKIEPRKAVDELYLVTLSRLPTAAELDRTLAYLKTAATPAEGYHDVLWSLLNRQEFIINR
jgi:hypothetical protein